MPREDWLEQFKIGVEKEENKIRKYLIINSFESSKKLNFNTRFYIKNSIVNSLQIKLVLKEKKFNQIESGEFIQILIFLIFNFLRI